MEKKKKNYFELCQGSCTPNSKLPLAKAKGGEVPF